MTLLKRVLTTIVEPKYLQLSYRLHKPRKLRSFAIKGRLIELPTNLNGFTATQFGKRIIVKMWNAN
jgi:hypothetical protein